MSGSEQRAQEERAAEVRRRNGMGRSCAKISVQRFLHGYSQTPSNYVFWKPEVTEAKPEEPEGIQENAQAAKVFLQQSPESSDMWEAARELIPTGKDKDFLIVYVPEGTGQPRMYADAFLWGVSCFMGARSKPQMEFVGIHTSRTTPF